MNDDWTRIIVTLERSNRNLRVALVVLGIAFIIEVAAFIIELAK